MSAIHTYHHYRVDLEQGPLHTGLLQPLCHQDSLADVFTVSLRRGNQPIDLTGMTVSGCMTFQSTRQTLPLAGEVSGSTATLTLTGDCYAIPGSFTLTIQVASGDVRHTLVYLTGEIIRAASDALISSGELLPPLPVLLEQIADMKSATIQAENAAAHAQTIAADMESSLAACAPVIPLEASGSAVIIRDAAARPAAALVTELSSADGVSAVTLRRCGRNLLNPDAIEALQVNTSTVRNGVKFTIPGVYCLRANAPTAQSGYLYARHYNEAGEVDGTTMYLVSGDNRSYTYTLESGSLYVWDATDRAADRSAAFMAAVQAQVEFDSFTDYTPYEGAVLTANLPETVYGGTLDWLTGTLTITADATGAALAEPVVHQLDPQSLTTLWGMNVIDSSAGSTRIAYAADTKTYIDNAIAAIAASVLNA